LVAREKISDPRSSFAELGMDSLGRLQVRSRIQAVFGVAVPEAALVPDATATGLAQWLSREIGLSDDDGVNEVDEAIAHPEDDG
jgi:acyl carrier protein